MKLFACLFITLPLYAFAGQSDVSEPRIVFAAFESHPLFYFDNERNFSGLLGAVVSAICCHGKIQCEFKKRPIARAYRDLETGQVDALLGIKSDRFMVCCQPSLWSYNWKAGIHYVNETVPIPRTTAELQGGALILVRGWESPTIFIPVYRMRWIQMVWLLKPLTRSSRPWICCKPVGLSCSGVGRIFSG